MTKPEDPGAKDGYQIIIDNRPHRWSEPTITGAQLKALARNRRNLPMAIPSLFCRNTVRPFDVAA